MRSLWSISYVGAHTATTIKKLERHMAFKAIGVETERFVFAGEKIERAVFFVEHSGEWSAVLLELLQKTFRIANYWQARGDARNEFSARIAVADLDTSFKQGLPPGIREVTWTVRLDQQYGQRRLAGSASPAW